MSIRAKLRLRAEVELHSMIEQLEGKALEICGDTVVDIKDLCRLVIGGRTQSVLNKVIGQLADQAEDQLMSDLAMPSDRSIDL